MFSTDRIMIPLYTSKGDADVFLHYPYLYNRLGEWVGWVTTEKQVYSVLGCYVGYISNDHRILCKRYMDISIPDLPPPYPPKDHVMPPATIPLAPMMSELLYSTVDVLLEEPGKLHTLDSGDLREDLD
jgi:hypothetical protein